MRVVGDSERFLVGADANQGHDRTECLLTVDEGVDADVRAGANVPFLDEVAWGALSTGAVLLLLSVALMYAGVRTRRPPRSDTGAPDPLPYAA